MKAVFLDRNTFSPSIDLPAPAGVTDWQVHDATPNDTATVVERLRILRRIAVKLMIAERTEHAERRAQRLQMRRHPLRIKRLRAVINNIAGQENDVHPLRRKNRRETIQLTRAEEKAAVQMQIGGDTDAQRLRHRLVERDRIMAHHRAVRIEKTPGEQRGESRRQKNTQRGRRPFRCEWPGAAVQHKPGDGRQKPQPEQREQPRLRDKQRREKTAERQQRQTITGDEHRCRQPTAPLIAP